MVPRRCSTLLGAVLLLAACGGDGEGEECAIAAVVDELVWCSTVATTSVEDGSLVVVARAPSVLVGGAVDEIRLAMPVEVPVEGERVFGWGEDGVVGALDIVDGGAVDPHQARVLDVVSGGELRLTRADSAAVTGTFDFVARGVLDLGERIPVEDGRFRAPGVVAP